MLSIFAGDASRRALYNVSSLRFGRQRLLLGGKLHTRGSDISISRGAAYLLRGWRMPRSLRPWEAAYPRERYKHIAGSGKPAAQIVYVADPTFEVTRGTVGWESFQMQIRYR